MTSALLDWMTAPAAGRGLLLADEVGGWQRHDYAELAGSARAVAAELTAAGVERGDVVCVVLPTDYQSLARFFGVWAAGAVVCPVAPPAMRAERTYVEYLASVLEQAKPVATLAPEQLCPLVAEALGEAGLPGTPWPVSGTRTDAPVRAPGEFALLQFTSGSTAAPRGIHVSWANLDANVAAIREWLEWPDGEGTSSWLPLYHDMGLIGCMMTTVAAQGDLWLMRPDQFIRDPSRWVRALSAGKARRTSAPPFGYAYAASRLAGADLDGIDLSDVHNAIVGAELIDPAALDAFADVLAPTGFHRRSFTPAYGLAEATLFVSGVPSAEVPVVVRPDWDRMAFGEPVVVLDSGPLGTEMVAAPGVALVGCGEAGRRIGVAVRDAEGAALPDGHLGEVVVTGDSVTGGYSDLRDGASTWFADGEIHTGDAGFRHGGDLFVLGRMGHSLKVRGRTVYMEQIEAAAGAAAGLRAGSYAAIGGVRGEGTEVVLVVERPEGDWVQAAAAALRRTLSDQVAVTVATGRRGLIEHTSSGKVRRRHLWTRWEAGRLAVTVVHRSVAR